MQLPFINCWSIKYRANLLSSSLATHSLTPYTEGSMQPSFAQVSLGRALCTGMAPPARLPGRPGTFRRDVVTLPPFPPAGLTPVRISPRFWLYEHVGLRAPPCVRAVP